MVTDGSSPVWISLDDIGYASARACGARLGAEDVTTGLVMSTRDSPDKDNEKPDVMANGRLRWIDLS
ncbi:hypothetical protein GCM10027436_34400 [Actinophytocola sediminis]